MISKTKLKQSFVRIRKDIDYVHYNTTNQSRYLNIKVKEQSIRIRELERRLAQLERITIREKVI